jgi:hypothetical protein
MGPGRLGPPRKVNLTVTAIAETLQDTVFTLPDASPLIAPTLP